MACGDEYVVALLDEGVFACLDNNYRDDFDVYFIHAHPLKNIPAEKLGGQCLVHHGYMNNIGWCDTYLYFCYQHKYKNRRSTMITWMIGGRRSGMRPRSTYTNAINTLSNI